MKRAVGLTLIFSLFFYCGCSSLQVTGQPFGQKSGTNVIDLASYLQNGISVLTKGEIGTTVPGTPEITINEGMETWFFQYSRTTSKLSIGLTQTRRANNFSIEELTLTFNKNGILTGYQIKSRSGQNTEKSSHTYKLGDSLFVGVVSAIVFGIINDILGKMKK